MQLPYKFDRVTGRDFSTVVGICDQETKQTNAASFANRRTRFPYIFETAPEFRIQRQSFHKKSCSSFPTISFPNSPSQPMFSPNSSAWCPLTQTPLSRSLVESRTISTNFFPSIKILTHDLSRILPRLPDAFLKHKQQ